LSEQLTLSNLGLELVAKFGFGGYSEAPESFRADFVCCFEIRSFIHFKGGFIVIISCIVKVMWPKLDIQEKVPFLALMIKNVNIFSIAK
jgi:hypothetical protein